MPLSRPVTLLHSTQERLVNPVEDIVPTVEEAALPSHETALNPKPEWHPRCLGSGRLAGKVALITGADSGRLYVVSPDLWGVFPSAFRLECCRGNRNHQGPATLHRALFPALHSAARMASDRVHPYLAPLSYDPPINGDHYKDRQRQRNCENITHAHTSFTCPCFFFFD